MLQLEQRLQEASSVEDKQEVWKQALLEVSKDSGTLPAFISLAVEVAMTEISQPDVQPRYVESVLDALDGSDTIAALKGPHACREQLANTIVEFGLHDRCVELLSDPSIRDIDNVTSSCISIVTNVLNNYSNVEELYPLLIPKIKRVATSRDTPESTRSCTYFLLAIAVLHWPQLVLDDHLITTFLDMAEDVGGGVRRQRAGMRCLVNLLRVVVRRGEYAAKAHTYAKRNMVDESDWAKDKVMGLMKGGRVVNVVRLQISSPRTVQAMQEAQSLFQQLVLADMEEYMKPLLVQPVLRGLCVTGVGTDDEECQRNAVQLALWVLRESVEVDGKFPLLESDPSEEVSMGRALYRLADHAIDSVITSASDPTPQDLRYLCVAWQLAGVGCHRSTEVAGYFAVNAVVRSFCLSWMLISKHAEEKQKNQGGLLSAVYGLAADADICAGLVVLGVTDWLASFIGNKENRGHAIEMKRCMLGLLVMLTHKRAMLVARQKEDLLTQLLMLVMAKQAAQVPQEITELAGTIISVMRADEDKAEDSGEAQQKQKASNENGKPKDQRQRRGLFGRFLS